MIGITKKYRKVPTVRNVSFTVMPAEIHFLPGENGAGKSTLTKIIAGITWQVRAL